MTAYRRTWLPLVLVATLACSLGENSRLLSQAPERGLGAEPVSAASSTASTSPGEGDSAPASEDLLDEVLKINQDHPVPAAEFRTGHAEPLEFDSQRIEQTEDGFVIRLPSESPLPTPTIDGTRLYVSGGFSSQEYYCFDARNGEFIWGARLDDDGPSSCVPHEDSIIFSCESCTLFALNAETGAMRWSHWLGDPLLSMPALADGRVFAIYPASFELEFNDEPPAAEVPEPANPDSEEIPAAFVPTHVLACFDAGSGELRWQRWLGSDCMSAPVITDGNVYVTTLAGSLHRFQADDGRLEYAKRLRATSVPIFLADTMYLTRRADRDDEEEIAECIVRYDRPSDQLRFVAATQPAPYLDPAVQREAEFSTEAASFEAVNGIGGGFGGGFGGGPNFGFGFGAGGQFAVADEAEDEDEHEDEEAERENAPAEQDMPADMVDKPLDPLAVTELQAADLIGLGNVSTLQMYQGSRLLYWRDHLFACMGHRLVCTSATTGDVRWTTELEGDLESLGGHLASPPVLAGRYLLIATVQGEVQQIDPQTGDLVKRYAVGSPLRCSPVVHEGRIYIGTQDGKLVCINTHDPQLTGWPMWGRDPAHTNVALEH